jgi:hypothetical protein
VLNSGVWWPGAAAVLVGLAPFVQESPSPGQSQPKGGDVALSLVGELHGADAAHFAQHERFKLRVTCAPALAGRLRAAVYQGSARYEPLRGGALPRCGNAVPWPGAFTLDGHERASVCVRWDGAAWPARAPTNGERGATCQALDPAR